MPALDQLAVVGVGLRAVDDAVCALAVGRTETSSVGTLAMNSMPSSVLLDAPPRWRRRPDRRSGLCRSSWSCGCGPAPARSCGRGGPWSRRHASATRRRGHRWRRGRRQRSAPRAFRQPRRAAAPGTPWRPSRSGHSRHAPLDAVIHCVLLPGLHKGTAREVDAVQLARIKPASARDLGMDGQRAAAVRVSA